eukprot:6186631-Pleurochrysis_carterae.AAC.2
MPGNASEPRSFAERIVASALLIESQRVVVATYGNVGRVDWLVLFARWLRTSRIPRFAMMGLDEAVCAVAHALQLAVPVECITAVGAAAAAGVMAWSEPQTHAACTSGCNQ